MLYITYADAVKYLREIVEEYGADYVNSAQEVPDDSPSCVYRNFETDAPSCGVGHVMHRAGFDLTQLTINENIRAWNALYRELREFEKLGMHYQTQELLRIFQVEQDCENTWGTALTRALKETSEPENDTPPV